MSAADSPDGIDPQHTVLLLVDTQNDFLHPDGAYARAGVSAPALTALADCLTPVADACRAADLPVVATLFTVPTGRAGARLVAPHLAELRPFLTAGGFEPGSWGQAVIEELAPVDTTVEKVAYSAFHASRLEHVLRAMEVETLIVAGIVTNGGVASTLRDAHVRGFATLLLTDGCAAFDPEVHDATITSLASISPTITCAELTAALTD